MTYIILAAGKGYMLKPLTLKYVKTSYKLDINTSVIQNLVIQIRKYDKNAEIVVVVGYLADNVKNELIDMNVKFIENPFYEITNTISSLWFARNYLERENVSIVHGDVVFSDKIINQYLCTVTDYPYVVVDSSLVKHGVYNVAIEDDKVVVMSEKLEKFTAKYSCLTKLDAVSSRLLKEQLNNMIYNNMYDQYFENVLVQMIMFHDFQLFYKDIAGEEWVEINDVNDLIVARRIYKNY